MAISVESERTVELDSNKASKCNKIKPNSKLKQTNI